MYKYEKKGVLGIGKCHRAVAHSCMQGDIA
jgi:hypothetical protein